MKQLKGPKTPGLIQKIQWSIDPLGYLEAATKKYPDIFKARITPVSKTQVLVSNPQIVEQYLLNQPKAESKTEFGISHKSVLRPVMGEQSMFLLEGKPHQRQRKLLMPPLHGEKMRSYGQIICDLTEKEIAKLSPGQVFSARAIMQDISLEVILKVVFGLYEGDHYKQLRELFVYLSGIFKSFALNLVLFSPSLQKDLGSWSPWGEFLRKRKEIDRLIYAEIKHRRANPDQERTDILSLLLSARYEDGEPMTDSEIRDQLITLLLTGHETSATAMAWSLYWVHYHPEVREKLIAEIDSLGNSPDLMDIFHLPYLTAVCNESLRIYPVLPLTTPLKAKSPINVMGYELESGTVIQACIYLIHHRPDLYPDSKQFKPERFLERKFSSSEFIPFGLGVRRCMGAALAMYEMKLVLATLLSRCQLALVDNQPIKPIRSSITLVPAGGIRMVVVQGRRIPHEYPQATANLL